MLDEITNPNSTFHIRPGSSLLHLLFFICFQIFLKCVISREEPIKRILKGGPRASHRFPEHRMCTRWVRYLPFEKYYLPDSKANSWFRSAFGVD